MRNFLLFLGVAGFAAGAFAQGVNTSIIKQRAREVSGQKQAPLPQPAAPAQRPAATGARSQLSAAQQQNIRKLTSDLAIIKGKSQATPEQKQKLGQNLLACAQGANRPSAESVTKLANDLATALHDKTLSAPDQARLAGDLATVLNSANVPPAEAAAALASARDILTACGVTTQDAQAVVKDLQAIAAEAQKAASTAAK